MDLLLPELPECRKTATIAGICKHLMDSTFRNTGPDVTQPIFCSFPLRPIAIAMLAVSTGFTAAHALGVPATTEPSASAAATMASSTMERRWIDVHSQKPRAVARQAIRQLAMAEQEGLVAQDYQVQALEEALVAAIQKNLSAEEGVQLEGRINQAVLRYLNDLHSGRINPKTIGENYTQDARPSFDADALLAQYARSGNLEPVWQAATPQAPMYAGLRAELQRYLALRDHPAWAEPLPLPPKGKPVMPAQSWSHLVMLAQRLTLLGDAPAIFASSPVILDPGTSDALESFQRRHGLPVTGALDRATAEQLNVHPTQRAEQIAQTMERLRWAPLYQTGRMIVVNVPEYRLRAYAQAEGAKAQQPVLSMNVIVGKANHQRTPLFNKDMVRVEFSPYWNVPPSITRKEMMPRLQRDPDYVRRNNYEIINSSGARVEANADTLAALASGSMRLRQRPGRGNALGDVKFIFPNKDNIYLHHTSAPGLFSRGYRALSHGCVRIESPDTLAQFVLQGDPQWPESRIRQVMDRRISQTAQVQEPLPVILTYLTAVIDEEGSLKFVPDVYGQDKRLKNALLKRKDT